jgi:hypothetical protein
MICKIHIYRTHSEVISHTSSLFRLVFIVKLLSFTLIRFFLIVLEFLPGREFLGMKRCLFDNG